MIPCLKKGTKFQSLELFPDDYIGIEGTNLMSTFYKNSLNKVPLKSTTTRQCYTYKTFSSNSYLTSPSISNDTTYDNFINTTYEVGVTSIDNE